ncbi:MAG TPA: hypothetical protein VML75_12075 [Kofleriaceae bacterium]|nr:hypothetical protein [Kofleriaceae bacterium]
MIHRATMTFLCVGLALGCGKKREQEPATAPAPEAGAVAVLRDGTPVATLPAAAFAAEQPLASVTELGPPGEWRLVTGRGEGGRELYIRDPARAYDGHTIKLYRDQRGQPAVGVFRNPRPTTPRQLEGLAGAPVIYLTGVASIDVRTQKEDLPAAKEPSLELRVPGTGGPITLEGTQLQALAALEPPDRRESSTGWSLADVIGAGHALDGAPAVQLIGEGGATLDIPAGALTDPTQILLLKLNRRGQYRFKWWKREGAPPPDHAPGKAPQHATVVQEMRGVQAIQVR